MIDCLVVQISSVRSPSASYLSHCTLFHCALMLAACIVTLVPTTLQTRYSWKKILSVFKAGLWCRYFHPSPPHRAVKTERTFEGISLDTPGQSSRQVMQMSRFQLCSTCYQREGNPSSGVCVRACVSMCVCVCVDDTQCVSRTSTKLLWTQ